MDLTTSQFHFTKEKILREEEEIKAAVADPAKFAVLYDRYYLQIFRFIFQRVKSEDMAADITSQVFVKAMQNLPRYRFMGYPLASWIYRIARNELNLQFKKNQVWTVNINDTNIKDVAEELGGGDEDLMPLLVKGIRELDDEEVELLEMKYFEGRPYKEICEVTGLTESNAKVKVFRTVKKLKAIIERLQNQES